MYIYKWCEREEGGSITGEVKEWKEFGRHQRHSRACTEGDIMPCIWNDWLPAGLVEQMKRGRWWGMEFAGSREGVWLRVTGDHRAAKPVCVSLLCVGGWKMKKVSQWNG